MGGSSRAREPETTDPASRGRDETRREAGTHAGPRRRDALRGSGAAPRAACQAGRAASRASAWPATLTGLWTASMRPSGPITKVLRMMPWTLRPYICFSP
ncbi:hypothetical protein SAMN02745121_00120 [Nannocystis exedens]|uniref:Uncharacterized protein n=1 Tax=Nannocystis exedens TaxID=54 RepID=A0A1I1SLL2_9BACT|nr:hypothetical protein NAEX_08691 [Nannocystis exedens]SFD47375.1 hypothetical protein SAMN02745121_00120 [Nannocystis exedens]